MTPEEKDDLLIDRDAQWAMALTGFESGPVIPEDASEWADGLRVKINELEGALRCATSGLSEQIEKALEKIGVKGMKVGCVMTHADKVDEVMQSLADSSGGGVIAGVAQPGLAVQSPSGQHIPLKIYHLKEIRKNEPVLVALPAEMPAELNTPQYIAEFLREAARFLRQSAAVIEADATRCESQATEPCEQN